MASPLSSESAAERADKRRVAQLFDGRAVGYDAAGFHVWLADHVASSLVSKPGRLLDVAAGTGLVTRAARCRTDAVLIDISAGMLREAASMVPDAARVRADAHRLPFEADTFDSAVCVAADRFVDLRRVLQECARVLASGGEVVFTRWLDEDEAPVASAASHDLTDEAGLNLADVIVKDWVPTQPDQPPARRVEITRATKPNTCSSARHAR